MGNEIDWKITLTEFLETKRLRFRSFEERDLDKVYEWGTNQLYNQTAGFVVLSSIDQAKQVIEKYKQRPQTFALELKETGTLVGMIELNERGLDEQSGLLATKEFGVLVDQKFWRQGLMNEALAVFIPYVFETLNQRELWAGVFPSNTKSKQMLEKFGFEFKYTADYSAMGLPKSYNEDYYLLSRINYFEIFS